MLNVGWTRLMQVVLAQFLEGLQDKVALNILQ